MSQNFNPRSPHGERQSPPRSGGCSGRYFNPRSPHGERRVPGLCGQDALDFNPRSPHGERRDRGGRRPRGVGISIHAPRTGSDETFHSAGRSTAPFQSTLPARGATNAVLRLRILRHVISIHAPRTGSDARTATMKCNTLYFNPRSPHGERHDGTDKRLMDELISIHAPRTGSDKHGLPLDIHAKYFNPRSPHGERPGLQVPRHRRCNISIHAPRTGSDCAK